MPALGVSTMAVPQDGTINGRLPRYFFPEDLSFLSEDGATVVAATDGEFGSTRLTADVAYDRSTMGGLCAEGKTVALASDRARIVVADHDLIRTVHTAAQLLHPTSVFTAANVTTHGHTCVIALNGAVRFCLFGMLNTVTTAIGSGTMPILNPYLVRAHSWDAINRRFIGMTGLRRAGVDDYTTAGITINFNASPTTSNTMTLCGPAASAGGWYISNPEPDQYGYDCRGYDFLFFLRAQVHGTLTGTNAKMWAAVELVN